MAWWTENLAQGQRAIVNKAITDVQHTPQGAMVWVQGCAGTGKTLVLAHIAREFALMEAHRSIAFLTYTHALKEMISVIIANGSVQLHVSTYKAFLYRKPIKKYEIILIDEVQDISKEELAELQDSCTHLIVAGDCEQKIYKQGSTEPEIDQIITFNKGRIVELFRITESIIEWAKKIIPSTKLFSGDVQKEKDTDIAVRCFEHPQQEARWVYDEALAFARPEYPSAILFPTHTEIYQFCRLLALDLGVLNSGPKVQLADSQNGYRIDDYNQLNAHFQHHNLPAGYLGNSIGKLSQSNNRPFVYLMTYHSAKGLDFRSVFLPRLSSHIQISSNNSMEKALFFVAVTRARERLLVTYTGDQPYPLVKLLPDFNNRVVHHNLNNDGDDDDEGIF